MATSNGPCLRVSHGSVPVSAKLTRGAIAGVVRGLGEDHRAEGRRRQEHDLAVGQMRREQPRDIGLRKRRRRAQDQLGAADGFGDVDVTSASCTSWRPLMSLTQDAGARRAMLRHLRRVAPPQPDVMALQGKIARGREGAIAAAEYRDLQTCFLLCEVIAGCASELAQHEMLHLAQSACAADRRRTRYRAAP